MYTQQKVSQLVKTVSICLKF